MTDQSHQTHWPCLPSPNQYNNQPGVFYTEVHEVCVSCSVHCWHQHLTNLGSFDVHATDYFIPVSPLTTRLLLGIVKS